MSGIRITWGKHSWDTNDKGVYTLKGTVAERNGGWMHMTFRHPYEDDQMRFDGHARAYRAVDFLRLEYLLRHLVAEGTPHFSATRTGRSVPWRTWPGDEPVAHRPFAASCDSGGARGGRPGSADRSTAKPPSAS
ncbi:hypothetical protein [Streptomyces rishiriensis]|uniref:hypothetical protein n=1 Tax=Streptomyces rishiriensis TaxID=68264 RepID=UPI0037D6A215